MKLPSSVQLVISNDHLLTEIFARLPVFSLVLFKSVSKRWCSLIKDGSLGLRRKLDPPSGIIFTRIPCKDNYTSYTYDLEPLDIRLPLLTFGPYVGGKLQILDSCNGLLLCLRPGYNKSEELYVYNPSITNMSKLLPELDNVTCYQEYIDGGGGLKIAFDPTKSPHYKVIYAQIVESDIDDMDDMAQLHTFSSETANWSLYGHQFPEHCFSNFEDGVYWNDATYWLDGNDKIFKLDIMNEHPVLTVLQTAKTFDEKVTWRLFESRGCLLLLGTSTRCLTIYEKRNMYSEWSVKHIVIKPFPKSMFSECPTVFRIVLGEREEDSFLVIKRDTKVVKYKIVSRTLTTIYDLGPNYDLHSCFWFIPSFANV